MKKILTPLFVLICSVCVGGVAYITFVDETPPSGLVAIKNSLYYKQGQIWLDKGGSYGFNRMARYSDLPTIASTDLSLGTITSTTIPILNSNGTGFTIPQSTTLLAGLLNSTDKIKLNDLSGVNSGNQQLVLGTTGGNFSINGTGGNAISLSSLRTETTGFENANTTPASSGLFVGSNSSSATNYVAAVAGLGVKVYRNSSTALGYFEFWGAQSSSDALYYRKGSGASTFNSWHIIAAQDWVSTSYAPLASPSLTGTPLTPTPASDINTTQIVNGAWANTYYAKIINKQNSLTADGTGVKYPTVDAVNAGLALKQASLSGTGFIKISGNTITYDNSSYASYPIVNTSLTIAQTSTTLNAAYPSAATGQQVTAPNVGTGMKYEKINTTGGGTWVAWAITTI